MREGRQNHNTQTSQSIDLNGLGANSVGEKNIVFNLLNKFQISMRASSEDMSRLHLGRHETPLGNLVGREYMQVVQTTRHECYLSLKHPIKNISEAFANGV